MMGAYFNDIRFLFHSLRSYEKKTSSFSRVAMLKVISAYFRRCPAMQVVVMIAFEWYSLLKA